MPYNFLRSLAGVMLLSTLPACEGKIDGLTSPSLVDEPVLIRVDSISRVLVDGQGNPGPVTVTLKKMVLVMVPGIEPYLDIETDVCVDLPFPAENPFLSRVYFSGAFSVDGTKPLRKGFSGFPVASGTCALMRTRNYFTRADSEGYGEYYIFAVKYGERFQLWNNNDCPPIEMLDGSVPVDCIMRTVPAYRTPPLLQ